MCPLRTRPEPDVRAQKTLPTSWFVDMLEICFAKMREVWCWNHRACRLNAKTRGRGY